MEEKKEEDQVLQSDELAVKLIYVKEKHPGYKVLIVFNRELVVMHPSLEIVSMYVRMKTYVIVCMHCI